MRTGNPRLVARTSPPVAQLHANPRFTRNSHESNFAPPHEAHRRTAPNHIPTLPNDRNPVFTAGHGNPSPGTADSMPLLAPVTAFTAFSMIEYEDLHGLNRAGPGLNPNNLAELLTAPTRATDTFTVTIVPDQAFKPQFQSPRHSIRYWINHAYGCHAPKLTFASRAPLRPRHTLLPGHGVTDVGTLFAPPIGQK